MKTLPACSAFVALLTSWIKFAAADEGQSPLQTLIPDLCQPDSPLCKPNTDPGRPNVCRPDLQCRPGSEEPVTVTVYNYVTNTTSVNWVRVTKPVTVTDTKTVVSVVTSYGDEQVICKPTSTVTHEATRTLWDTSTTIGYNLTTITSSRVVTSVVVQPSNPNCVTNSITPLPIPPTSGSPSLPVEPPSSGSSVTSQPPQQTATPGETADESGDSDE